MSLVSSGHRLGASTAPHVLEVYLDYVCPFSAKLYKRVRNEVLPYIEENYPGKVQFIFRHQVQPWHPFSTVVHEAALAVEKIESTKFFQFSDKLFEVQKQYFDESVHNLSRAQIYESLAKHVKEIGMSDSQFLSLLYIPVVSDIEKARNEGNKITSDLKLHIKLGRETRIHVSPTVLFDKIVDNEVSSGWNFDQWKEWLAKKVVYSQDSADTNFGIGVIPEYQTWYICSKGLTNYINYILQVVKTPENATNGFGINEVGNRPQVYDKEGLLVFVSNYTFIRSLIDQNAPKVLYLPDLSCGIEPVQKCEGLTDPPLDSEQIYCLGVVNPNKYETKFTASISFTKGAARPPLVIPIEETTPTESTPTKATPPKDTLSPSDTRSFILPNDNIANKLDMTEALTKPRNVNHTLYKLYDWMERGLIDTNPEFQRDIVWNNTKQCHLIDSILKNYYVPPILFSCKKLDRNRWLRICIDGKQRLTSIRRFMNNEIPYLCPSEGRTKKTYYENIDDDEQYSNALSVGEKEDFDNSELVCIEYYDLTILQEQEIFSRVQLGLALTTAEKLHRFTSPIAELAKNILEQYPSINKIVDNKRGKPFQLIVQALHMMELNPTKFSANPGAITKYLQDDRSVPQELKQKSSRVFAELDFLIKVDDEIFTKDHRFAPIEFVFFCYILAKFSDLEMAWYQDTLLQMKEYVRKYHADIRFNQTVYKTLWNFVEQVDDNLQPDNVHKSKRRKKN
ncbi:5133_t:CDS:10 [Funneliformis caledonium]|uniref:5133_t:CDS:1 n=1 Tax=Funneliformis caledonium TaxID=1117310 RepID=A0A9N8VWB4_9GLOM|nr:5133_t:CDS:10 [Funneliformis caledonium]